MPHTNHFFVCDSSFIGRERGSQVHTACICTVLGFLQRIVHDDSIMGLLEYMYYGTCHPNLLGQLLEPVIKLPVDTRIVQIYITMVTCKERAPIGPLEES